jgi:transcriptional regulator with XRE-family HTH domain
MRNIKKAESLKRFGARLRQIRETAEISQEQIQYATGITQSHLSMIESGRLNTGLSHIAALAEFFGLEEFQLLQYADPVPASDILKKNVARYLKKNGIDPSLFLKKSLALTLRTKVIPSKFLSTPRYTKEIADLLEQKFGVAFTTSAISQALENLRKEGLVEKLATDNKSKFQYRKK